MCIGACAEQEDIIPCHYTMPDMVLTRILLEGLAISQNQHEEAVRPS